MAVFEAGSPLGSVGVENHLLFSLIIMDTNSSRNWVIVFGDIEPVVFLRMNLGCLTVTRPLHHSQPVGVRIESAIIVKTVKINL